MKAKLPYAAMVLALAVITGAQAQPPAGGPVPVTADNFPRAESDLYFSGVVKNGGFGKFDHTREPAPLDKQTVIRLNRDTLYSAAVFDLDAGSVTITLPDAGKRFMSLQVIDEDQYTHGVYYGGGGHELTREGIGTRYVLTAVRTLVDPTDPKDLEEVHALQDAIKVRQQSPGRFEVPNWDLVSQKKVREALLVLASTLPDTKRMFGSKDRVDPVRFLIGAASAWGGNPEQEALYLNIVPTKNDGTTIYKLNVKDVPVDGFWSVSVYNAEGYYQQNQYNAYSLNSITAKKDKDGAVTVQFGGCDGKVVNCLPTMKGWNYMVRLYRPHAEILDGKWTFPIAQEVISPDETAMLLGRGRDMLKLGDMPAARLLLRRAAEAGNSEAAFMLASTFDPIVIREVGVIGVAPDLNEALAWYEKASALGSEEAKRRIERLGHAGNR